MCLKAHRDKNCTEWLHSDFDISCHFKTWNAITYKVIYDNINEIPISQFISL